MYMQEGKESPKKCIRQEGGEEERKQGRKDGIREGARDLFLLDKLISNHLSKNVGWPLKNFLTFNNYGYC